ncbi:MAG TPA: hypothetical protein VKA67_12930, partial [Verrucomicrobiae bacterium]|nr:hypothetical protein [Verrucomicrobiae bacterium]
METNSQIPLDGRTNEMKRHNSTPKQNPTALKLKLKSWEAETFCVAVTHFNNSGASSFSSKRVAQWRSLVLLAVFALWHLQSNALEVNCDRWRWSSPLPHGNNVLDMFVTGDLAVQVGDAGAVYVQHADERWAPAITGTTNYLRGAALLGERFIVTGENGCILWS